MLQAYRDGKDLYVEIASIAMHVPYKMCLEHFPKNCPIKQNEDGKWEYALLKSGQDDGKQSFLELDYSDINPEDYNYDKLADGETDTYKQGKEYRNQAKKILLGIMYGRGEKSIAEQLGCSVEEARDIKDNVYTAFPKIKEFERSSSAMVKEKGYVTTLWGRKRRLPDYNLPTFEFHYCDDNGNILEGQKVPESDIKKFTQNLESKYWKARATYIEELRTKHKVIVIENGSKIAAAGRQIINSRVQGCLDGDTIIKTKELGEVNISSVSDRSDLHVWDGSDWTTCDILPSGKKRKCIITLENGTTITCSPDHKFKVKSNDTYIWKACKDLTGEDDILIENEA